MGCPHCAEWVGLMSLARRRCSRCGLPLFAVATSASPELRRAVAARALRLRWLLVGVVATGFLSLLPTMGLVQLLVLAPLQLFCVEKGVADITEQLPTRALLVFELSSGLLFLLLAASSGLVGAFAETASVVVTVPTFVVAYFGARELALSLGRRAVEGRGLGWLAAALLFVLAMMLVVPPVLLLGATAKLSAGLEASTWSVSMVLRLAAMASLSALDLFLMPAWLTAILAFLGSARLAPSFEWVGSLWFLLLMTALVVGEAVVDNAFDRRRRFSRTVWPRLQGALTPVTLFFLVCVLGEDLTWEGRFLALGAGLLGGWPLRRLANRAKTAAGFFPGAALAARRAQLFTIPFRLAVALGAVALARWQPVVASVIIAASVVLALAALAVGWVARRAMRRSESTSCLCGEEVSRRARVCWKCHQPLVVTLVRRQPPAVREVMSAAASFVGASAEALAERELATLQLDAAELRTRARDLDTVVVRDVIAVASSFDVGLERVAALTRLLAHRRSLRSALLEEL